MQQVLNRLGMTRAGSFSVGLKAPTAKPIADLLDRQLRRWTMIGRPLCRRILRAHGRAAKSAAAAPGLAATTLDAMSRPGFDRFDARSAIRAGGRSTPRDHLTHPCDCHRPHLHDVPVVSTISTHSVCYRCVSKQIV